MSLTLVRPYGSLLLTHQTHGDIGCLGGQECDADGSPSALGLTLHLACLWYSIERASHLLTQLGPKGATLGVAEYRLCQ